MKIRLSKQFISAIIILSIIMGVFPTISSASAVEIEKGSIEFIKKVNPIEIIPEGYIGIYSAADLNAVRFNLAGNYILMDDIDLSLYGDWEPIGDIFSGTFNGNGHCISALELTGTSLDSTAYNQCGLFERVSGDIMNLEIRDSRIKMVCLDSSYIGLIAGYLMDGGSIENCFTNQCTIYIETPKSVMVGGILGDYSVNDNITVRYCLNSASIVISDSDTSNTTNYSSVIAGGIAGRMSSVLGCVNIGNITIFSYDDSAGNYIGGILGRGDASSCANHGNITVEATPSANDSLIVKSHNYIGGISGISTNSISNCYNSGKICADIAVTNTSDDKKAVATALVGAGGIVGCAGKYTKTSYSIGALDIYTSAIGSVPNEYKSIGGIIGRIESSGTVYINNCFYTSFSLYGSNIQGATVNSFGSSFTSAEKLQQQGYFGEYDFQKVWTMGSRGYPYPIIQNFQDLYGDLFVDDNTRFVRNLTDNSLTYADDETRESIQNAIYNLLFKAQFRPNATTGLDCVIDFGVYGGYHTQREANGAWQRYNRGGYGQWVTDAVLGTYNIVGGAGCNAYARFVASYVYGTTGSGNRKGGLTGEAGLKEVIHKYADPGEHLQIGGGSVHSVAFLGEDAYGTGFYYIDYGDARGTDVCNITLRHISYADFAAAYSGYRFYIHDTNSGSYYQGGSVKSIAEVRENQITKIIKRIACPVEATVTLGNETLSSRHINNASFGSVSRDGDDIIFILDYHEDYLLEIEGTGEGVMTMTVEYYVKNELIDKRVFSDVPVTPTTQMQSGTIDPNGAYTLAIDLDGDSAVDSVWGAGVNETVTAENNLFLEELQTDGMDYASERETRIVNAAVDGNSAKAIMQCSAGTSAVAVCAAYDQNARLLRVSCNSIPEGDTTIVRFPLANNEVTVKFFILDALHRPLCEARDCLVP